MKLSFAENQKQIDDAAEAELRAERIDKDWDQRVRQELVATLLSGQTLYANGQRLADFEDVINKIFDNHADAHDNLCRQAVHSPRLAGNGLGALVKLAAGEVVDQYATELKQDIAKEQAA